MTEIGSMIGRMDQIPGAMWTTVEPAERYHAGDCREGRRCVRRDSAIGSALREVVLVAGQAGTERREMLGTAGIDKEICVVHVVERQPLTC